MAESRKVKVKVLDRHINRGWFWDTHYVTFRILDEDWTANGRKVVEMPVSEENYWDMPPDAVGTITLYKQSNGKWGARA